MLLEKMKWYRTLVIASGAVLAYTCNSSCSYRKGNDIKIEQGDGVPIVQPSGGKGIEEKVDDIRENERMEPESGEEKRDKNGKPIVPIVYGKYAFA